MHVGSLLQCQVPLFSGTSSPTAQLEQPQVPWGPVWHCRRASTRILHKYWDDGMIYIYIAIIEYICRWDRTSYNDIKVSELWNECSHWADVPTLEATNGWFTSNLTFLSRFPFKDFPYSLTILNPYQRLWASEISASSSVPQIPRGSRSRSRFVCLSLFLIWGSHHCVWEGQSVAASIEFLRLHVCCNCWPECHQLQCSY